MPTKKTTKDVELPEALRSLMTAEFEKPMNPHRADTSATGAKVSPAAILAAADKKKARG